jgi:hypothetical protein
MIEDFNKYFFVKMYIFLVFNQLYQIKEQQLNKEYVKYLF